MKVLHTFTDARAVQLSLDTVVPNSNKSGIAYFPAGVPITVKTGQRLIVTTAGILLEEIADAYAENSNGTYGEQYKD